MEAIDVDSYRMEVQNAIATELPGVDAELDPVPIGADDRAPEPELGLLSNILQIFNEESGNIEWEDRDKAHKVITEGLPQKIAVDKAY